MLSVVPGLAMLRVIDMQLKSLDQAVDQHRRFHNTSNRQQRASLGALFNDDDGLSSYSQFKTVVVV